MKSLLIYLKDYKKESVLGPLFKLLEASFDLIVPLVMAAIIDVGIAGHDRNYIYKMVGVLVLLAVVGITCAITAQYFAAKASVGFATKLRYALFSHVQTLSFNEMDTIGSSTLIARMTSDVNQIQSGINLVLRLFLRSPFIVFGAMIMAFTVDVKAALVFVVAIPLLSLVVFGVMAVTMPMYKKVQGGLDKVLGRTRENLSGARVIRAFEKEAEEIESFRSDNELLANMQILVGRISGLTNPLTYVIINIATLFVIYISGGRVFDGYITQGEAVALVNYMGQILVELVKMANVIVNVTKSLACASRIEDIMNTRTSITCQQTGEKAESDDCFVAFDHVSMTYAGAHEESLTDITFRVKKGQTIGIIGGTGSGKTSLVHLIPRFYDVSAGKVTIGGTDVKELPLTELRQGIGMVMQKAVLFAGTIEENLKWGKPDATEAEMLDALRIAQGEDIIANKEGGLSAYIEEGGKNLSGGQRQRLTIARAVIRKPRILILDDSASALDFATDAKLRSALKNMAGEMTIFIVSQRTSSIQFADQIIVLDDGQMAGIGTHQELLASCDVYREIYESQFRKEENKGKEVQA